MNAVPSPLQGGSGEEADPSMEEILASIRRIIADEHGAPIPSRPAPLTASEPPRLKPEPPRDLPERMPRFEAAAKTSFASAPGRFPPDPSVRAERPDRFDRPERAERPERPPSWPVGQPPSRSAAARPSFAGERLVSPDVDSSVASAFDRLSRSLSATGGGSMDDTVRDLLRPMLKQWLDDNLPTLVERLVRAEIERVARGGR